VTSVDKPRVRLSLVVALFELLAAESDVPSVRVRCHSFVVAVVTDPTRRRIPFGVMMVDDRATSAWTSGIPPRELLVTG